MLADRHGLRCARLSGPSAVHSTMSAPSGASLPWGPDARGPPEPGPIDPPPPRCDLGYEARGDGARKERDEPTAVLSNAVPFSRDVVCSTNHEGSRPGKGLFEIDTCL